MKRNIYTLAVASFKELRKQEGDSLQYYTVFREDGSSFTPDNHACYATIHGARRVENAEAIASLTTQYKKNPKCTMETTGAYYKWLIQYSPMAPVFKRKSVRKSVEEGIICNTDQPHNLTGAALISARVAYEYPRHVEIWSTLVEGGVHPAVAYMLMAEFKQDKGVFVVFSGGGGHKPTPCRVDKTTIANFVKGHSTAGEVASFKEAGGYNKNSDMWFGDGQSVSSILKPIFDKKYPGKKTLFGGMTPAGASKQDFVDEVLAFQKKLFKEYKL